MMKVRGVTLYESAGWPPLRAAGGSAHCDERRERCSGDPSWHAIRLHMSSGLVHRWAVFECTWRVAWSTSSVELANARLKQHNCQSLQCSAEKRYTAKMAVPKKICKPRR